MTDIGTLGDTAASFVEQLASPVRYRAKDVTELYHSLWEIEVGFRNLKSSLLDNALVLRSRKVDLLEQEVWGMLLAYNLIRRESTRAAEKHRKAPSEISFKFAF